MEEGVDSVTAIERLSNYNSFQTLMQHRRYSGSCNVAVVYQENADQAAGLLISA